MNKYIKEQLAKTKVNLPDYDDNSTTLFIPKTDKSINNADLQVGHCYYLFLEDFIINEPANFTLSVNWNNGTKPSENKIYAQVTQTMGKMIKVVSRSAENNIPWTGWLPRKGVIILEELNV